MIDRIGKLYVEHIRRKVGDRDSTWFDVAQAYAEGFAVAESLAKQRLR